MKKRKPKIYKTCVVAFIDILGFSKLVEKSEYSGSLQQDIRGVLNSISSHQLAKDLQGQKLNKSGHGMTEGLKRTLEITSAINKDMFPVETAFFSDSIVLSAEANNVIACQLLLDLVAKLNTRLWERWQLLTRGGIVTGKLYHEENGPLFGPALNLAYKLESSKAEYPRILIHPDCHMIFKTHPSFAKMKNLVSDGETDQYPHITIGSSLLYMATCTLEYKNKNSLIFALVEKLRSLESQQEVPRIKKKYQWLICESEKYTGMTY